MKRFFILFCYMLLAFPTPVRAAINSAANCKTRIEDKYNALYDFDKDAEYQTFYDSKYTQAKQKFNEWLDTVPEENTTGDCTINGITASFSCEQGQTHRECVPEQCWQIQGDPTYPDWLFSRQTQNDFIQQKILEECGSSPQSEPTPSDNIAPADTDTPSLPQNQKIQCEGPRYVLNEKKNRCEDLLNKKCTPTVENAKKGKNILSKDGTKIICQVTDCKNGYVPNNDGTACEQSEGDCTPEQLNEIPNATKGQKKKGVCYATDCKTGYDVEQGKCVAVSQAENEDDIQENNTENKEENDNTPKLSEEDSKKKIAELQENYDAMKEKEQSTENKLLGAGAMASIGAGGQMIASSLAEQQADAAAELDMTAYLATFRCDFGQGKNIKGGEIDIVLPGGNALAPLYTEYVKLAQDLKIRKEALGMAPGIESEEILDKANMGLYDNESLGKTDGAFTSLASALSNPTGADAAEWAAQKAKTAEQLKTGAITAGVGAVASIAANIAINENKNAKQENSAEIIKRYEALKKLQQDVEKLPDQEKTARCPTGSTGTVPNCTCTQNKQIYNTNANSCDTCPGEKIAVDNKCQCPAGTVPGENDTCTSTTATPQCDSSDTNISVNTKTGECTCMNGYIKTSDGENCECPKDTYTLDANNKCVKKQTPPSSEPQKTQTPQSITLSTSNLFKLNSSTLTEEATKSINTFASEIQESLTNETAYCINVTGHTDKTGTNAINNPLSLKRANAVKNALENAGLNGNNIKAYGAGSAACEKEGYQKECRKVEIEFTSSACSA